MTIPQNGAIARGQTPFDMAASPAQTYRFFSDSVAVVNAAPDEPGFLTRDLVEILQAGDAKSMPVRIVTAAWLEANPAAALAYDAWKRGRSLDAGTPLDAWAGIDRHMAAGCAVYNIFTVEQLAAVDDERLLRLGMGARELRARARLFLESRADAAAATRMQAEKDAMAAQMAALQEQLRQQQALMAQMAAEMQAARTPQEPPPPQDEPAPEPPPKRAPPPAKPAASAASAA